MKRKYIAVSSVISIVSLLSVFGFAKSPKSIHDSLIIKLQNTEVSDIDLQSEARKYHEMTEIKKKDMIKSFLGKKIIAEIVVDDVKELHSIFFNLDYHNKYFKNIKSYSKYFSSNFIMLKGDHPELTKLEAYYVFLPKEFLDLKKGQKITITGLIDNLMFSYYRIIYLYPASVIKIESSIENNENN